MNWKSYLPTKKWWTALVSGASALVISAIESSGFDDAEVSGAKVLAISLAVAYFKRNDPTIEGLPGNKPGA